MAKKIRAKVSGRWSDTAYIALPGHPDKPEPGYVSKTLVLYHLIENYKGPRIHLDFNKEGVLIGIEILA